MPVSHMPVSGYAPRLSVSDVTPAKGSAARRRHSLRSPALYFGSLAPSTSIFSITGAAASRFGALAIRAAAMGPLR